MAEQETTNVLAQTPQVGAALEDSAAREAAAERFGKGIELLKSAFELGKTVRDMPTTKAATDYQSELGKLTEKSGHELDALADAFRQTESSEVSRKELIAAGHVLAKQGVRIGDAQGFARVSAALKQFSEANGVVESDTAKLVAALHSKGTSAQDIVAALASTSRLAARSGIGHTELTRKVTESLTAGGATNFRQAAEQVVTLRLPEPAARKALADFSVNARDGGAELESAHAAQQSKKRKTSQELWEASNDASSRAMVAIGDALRPATDFMARSLTSTANGLAWLANTFPGTVAAVGGLGAAIATVVGTILAVRAGKKLIGGALDYIGGFGKGGAKGTEASAQDGPGSAVQDVRVVNWPDGGPGAASQRKGRAARSGRIGGRVGRMARRAGIAVQRVARSGVGRAAAGVLGKLPGIGVVARLGSLGVTLMGPGTREEKVRAAAGATGAVLGTAVGAVLGGPVGAIVGGMAGEYLGRKLADFGSKHASQAPGSALKGAPVQAPGGAVDRAQVAATPALQAKAAMGVAAVSASVAGATTPPRGSPPQSAPIPQPSQFNYAPQISIHVPPMANSVQGLAEQVASLLYERFRRADAAAARGMLGDQPFPLMGRA